MVSFSFVTLEGFGSFISPSFTYYLDSPGINLITGKNGAGKTTIFSALSWCLYGKTLKEDAQVEPWDDVAKNYKGTRVDVQFYVGETKVVVIRCKDYKGKIGDKTGGSKLFLTINGYVEPIRDKKDVQARIIELLGMSFNLFKNSIAFGQNLTRLLRESGPKQKELFDEAFEVTYINKAREKAAQYYSELQQKDDKLFIDCKHIDDLIKETRQTNQAYEEAKKEAKKGIKEVREELKEITKKIGALETLKNPEKIIRLQGTLQQKVERLGALENKHFKLDFTHGQEKAETQELSRQCQELAIKLAKPKPVCDRCGQVIKGTSAASKHKENQRAELNTKRAELSARRCKDKEREAELAQLTSSIKRRIKFRQHLKDINKTLEKEKINAKLKQEYLSARPKLKARLKTLKSRVEDLDQRLSASPLAGLEAKKDALVDQHAKLEKELKLHRWLIEDPLSNKGLKAFIFKAMLENVNQNLQKYGKFLGYSVRFSIDLDSGNKNFEAQIYSNENIRVYEDLSGGQKQLVDVALAFAIHDTIAETKKLNILLMDEVFESLDADNIELVSELIQHKSQGLSIHLITHQNSLTLSRVSKITKLQLKNAVTTAV